MKALATRCAALSVALLVPSFALAQSASAGDASASPAAVAATSLGDTGLRFVPAAEVLPTGAWTVGFVGAGEHRAGSDRQTSYAGLSYSRGVSGRAEVFGTWHLTSETADRRAVGDLLAGAKVTLLSARRGAPVAVALRSVVKVPTGSQTEGASSGRPDLLTEVVASRQFGAAELTGSTGFVLRGNPRGVDQPNGLRSGVGVAVMANRSLRLFGEVVGEHRLSDAAPTRLVSPLDTRTTASGGLTWILIEPLALSAAVSRTMSDLPDGAGRVSAAIQVGFRPTLGRSRPAATVPAPRPVPASTHAATTPARPSAAPSSGTPGDRATSGRGALAFEDVHFDLDRDVLRPEALTILDAVVAAMRADTSLRLQLDGHTCEIGTTEYNIALGDRRAAAVRTYLLRRGIDAGRMQTASYGEERPKHDMRTEETRALNRRVELRAIGTTGLR